MGNVPKLRFAEFNTKWDKKNLEKYGELVRGLTYSPDDIREEGLLVLRSSNIKNNEFTLNIDNVYVDMQIKEEYLTQKNDILICVRNGSKRLIGKSTIINNSLEYATHGAFMSVFRGKYNKFIYHWMQTPLYYKQVHKNLGATINSINGSDLKKFKTYFPQKQEQEKIASFLSTVDKKIEKLEEKIALQEKYKKAMMQKLFSQEIRFSPKGTSSQAQGEADDGSAFPAWEEKKLGDISKITMGQSPDSKSYNNNADGLYLIQGNADIKNRKSNPRNWTSEPTKECNIGDLLLTVRAPVGAIAKSYHNACIGRGVCAISNNKYSDIEYLYQYLLWFEKRWISLEQGSTFTAVSSSDIKTLKIYWKNLKKCITID